jgi:hypothetical protein
MSRPASSVPSQFVVLGGAGFGSLTKLSVESAECGLIVCSRQLPGRANCSRMKGSFQSVGVSKSPP